MTPTPRLTPGDQPPPFTLPDSTNTPISLSDHTGHPVLLYFYPRASTPGCTTQACDFRDNLTDLNNAGYTVLGISPDTPDQLAKFTANENLTFPLLSDPTKEVLTAYGAFGEKQNYGRTVHGVIRSTFVIDEKGIITHALYNVRATGHVAKIRKDLKI